MNLLERDQYLQMLVGYLRDAAAGHGRLVFVSGKAGVGKSALVRRCCDDVAAKARVVIASCDALSTPGPLGPLAQIGPALGLSAELLRPETSRQQLYHQIDVALQASSRPTILVGEDAHWADEATLNHLRYLGRRVGELPALVIITHRDDELGPRHPLRLLVGDLATQPAIRRIALPRLSTASVRTMAAGHDIDVDALVALTAGNPFFVHEILSSGVSGLPESVRDAVLARAARLSQAGRRLLDAAAVIGSPIDPALLASVAGESTEEAIEECLAVGALQNQGGALVFRHQLAREAVLRVMSPVRVLILSRRVLDVIQYDPIARQDAARLAHFAEAAGDREAVLTHAVAAAEQAAALGAHREAVAQYARALRFADALPPSARADLLERRSHECYLTGLLDEAVESANTALALRRDAKDRLREGDDLRRLAQLHWSSGRNVTAEEYARDALDVLEGLPPGPELAWAYGTLASLRMLEWSMAEAITWGERAIELAETLDQPEIMAHALNTVGAASVWIGDESGIASLERSLALAREHDFVNHASRALTNLAWLALLRWQLDRADTHVTDGIASANRHDLVHVEHYLVATRAVIRLRRGDWDGAAEDARVAKDRDWQSPLTRIVALTALGQIQVRRGDADSSSLDEAQALAERSGDFLRRGPVRAALAEMAMLAGDPARAAAEANALLGEAIRLGDRWLAGELVLILARVAELDLEVQNLPEPYACQLCGDWSRAAELWREMGCPYETARALVDGDEAAVREAWAIFDRLGARPDATNAARRLRELGASILPRGPRAVTRANPASLTGREMEVLALIVQGQPNRAIADRLFLSPRTVGHHVSAILGKLDVHSRADAARRAVELDLLQDRSSPSPT